MFTLGLYLTSLATMMVAGWLVLTGRITMHQTSGIAALGTIPASVAACLDGITSVAAMFAALGAVNAWIWWQSGGGDGTRRRLKSWVRRFHGVRRTAPQGA